MRNLKPYEEDPLDAFDAIVASKKDEPRKGTLTKLRPIVAQRYDLYAQNKLALESLPRHGSFSDAEAEALVHCYIGNTDALSELKSRIRGAQEVRLRSECQYCGLSESSTWDHYLPKRDSEFPEFSIYPPNLIPCCSRCNELRGTWLSGGQRTSINLYYDRFDPDQALVEAHIRLDVIEGNLPAVDFSLVVSSASETPFGQLFARHWQRLHLEERFRTFTATRMGAIRADIQTWSRRKLDAKAVMEELAFKAEDARARLGANHLDTILYRAVASSRRTVEYFLGQLAPSDAPRGATIHPAQETPHDA